MRTYRARYAAGGQASPLVLAEVVAPHLKGDSLADVGCGSGIFGYIFQASGQVVHTIGIDFSAHAVDLLRARRVYDEVHLADSARLPLGDRSVDTALSMENLEHVYAAHVPGALTELTRIARQQVVITTPDPWRVINRTFLAEEISAARSDPDLLEYEEFAMLAGYLHVSWLSPEQMAAAGFNFARNKIGVPKPQGGSMVYWADPAAVNMTHVGVVAGLARTGPPTDDGRGDWRGTYVDLLEEIATLRTPPMPRSLGILESAATTMAGFRGLARLGR